jgi:polyisoprenyl-phosphate glycosyltransferase
MAREPALLSVAAPMHDEEDTVAAFHARVVAALEGMDFELVIVDDGSRDGTGRVLADLAGADERVKVITLSRNFGHQAALTAALEHTTGDVVVMLDGDLQDPPELIPEMVDRWRGGADVVYAVRAARQGETAFKRTTASWFYRLFRRLADIDLTPESGDFRLMDRRALDALLAMPERNRFLRGMSVWVGFNQTAVTFEREPRGRSTRCAGCCASASTRSRASRTAPCNSPRCSGSRSPPSRSWPSRSRSWRGTRTSTSAACRPRS